MGRETPEQWYDRGSSDSDFGTAGRGLDLGQLGPSIKGSANRATSLVLDRYRKLILAREAARLIDRAVRSTLHRRWAPGLGYRRGIQASLPLSDPGTPRHHAVEHDVQLSILASLMPPLIRVDTLAPSYLEAARFQSSTDPSAPQSTLRMLVSNSRGVLRCDHFLSWSKLPARTDATPNQTPRQPRLSVHD